MKKIISLFIICFCSCGALKSQTDSPPPLLVDTVQPRVSDYIKEIERVDDHNQKISLVFWVPWQYWQTAMTQDGAKMNSASEDLINTIKNYTIIMVAEANVGPYGISSYKSEKDIRDSIQVIVNDSIRLKPIAEKNMNEQVRLLVSIMQPMMEKMLGQMGEHLCFFVFENESATGKKLIEAQKTGKFSVLWNSNLSFDWRLPLDILTPPKYCPVDGEKESGKYIYCPYHGVKLNLSK